MMDIKKIQIVGLPGTGKTSAIQSYLKKNKHLNIEHIDIRTYHEINPYLKETLFHDAIVSAKNSVIAESACGVFCEETLTIKMEVSNKILYSRLKSRDKYVDFKYIMDLAGQIIPCHYTINKDDELSSLLNSIFKARKL